MAEALVKREFSIHPETFVAVLRRAIAEAVEPGKFKIRVNPETYERVASLGQSDILESLVRDNEIATGDFKIESQLSVVDVSVTKMIAELLQQADLNLFQTEKKVG
jgi:flagellar biosynthesis/type III secretory pathway protein FliH